MDRETNNSNEASATDRGTNNSNEASATGHSLIGLYVGLPVVILVAIAGCLLWRKRMAKSDDRPNMATTSQMEPLTNVNKKEVLVILCGAKVDQDYQKCDLFTMEGKQIEDQPIMPPPPIVLHSSTVVTRNDEIYVFGGLNALGRPEKICYKFTMGTKRWRNLSDMGRARTGHTACVVRDFIIAVGGHDELGKQLNTAEKYDINSNRWMPIADYLHPVAFAASCASRGYCYVSGGGGSISMGRYNMDSDTWKHICDLSEHHEKHVMVVVNDMLYILGGEHTTSVEKVDLTTDHICAVKVGNLPRKIPFAAAYVSGDKIHLAGRDKNSNKDIIVIYDANTNTSSVKEINLQNDYDEYRVAFINTNSELRIG